MSLSLLWMIGIITILLQSGSYGYFGLTGKSQLRDMNDHDIEAETIFTAKDVQSDAYAWNSSGKYFTATSNEYKTIDLSPEPETDFHQTRGQRRKKNVPRRQTEDTHILDEHIMKASQTAVNQKMNIDKDRKKLISRSERPRAPSVHWTPSRTSFVRRQVGQGYVGGNVMVNKYRRKQNTLQRYRYGSRMYGISMRASTRPKHPYSLHVPLRFSARPPPRQAISSPTESISIDDIVIERRGESAIANRKRLGTGSSVPRLRYQQQRQVLNQLIRLTPDLRRRLLFTTQLSIDPEASTYSEQRPRKDFDNYRSHHESNDKSQPASFITEVSRKRHLYGKHEMQEPSFQSIEALSRHRVTKNEYELSNKHPSLMNKSKSDFTKHQRPRIKADTPNGSSTTASIDNSVSQLSKDISSIMSLIETERIHAEYLNMDNGLDPTHPSQVQDYDAGSRATDLPIMVSSSQINKKEAMRICNEIELTKKQKKFCRRDPGMPQVLQEATAISVAECQFQFRFERWNCSAGSTRIHLLSKGNRETAFLFAISSAGLTHSVARACAQGHLERCSCDEIYSDHVNQEVWIWGGCGDNVNFASKFVRKFLKSKYRSKDIRAEVDKHNSDTGVRLVKQSVKQTCKCHGVSGSCTTKTCWRKVAPFYEIGQKIKEAYDQSVKVGSINSANGKPKLIRLRRIRRNRQLIPSRTILSSTNHKNSTFSARTLPPVTSKTKCNQTVQKNLRDYPNVECVKETSPRNHQRSSLQHIRGNPRNSELVYLENSPAYCKQTRYSLGTRGRICEKEENCDEICCGRGYTTHIRIVRRACECEVKWCCYVKCKTCTEKKHIHTCK